jgi:hypothetical protein
MVTRASRRVTAARQLVVSRSTGAMTERVGGHAVGACSGRKPLGAAVRPAGAAPAAVSGPAALSAERGAGAECRDARTAAIGGRAVIPVRFYG